MDDTTTKEPGWTKENLLKLLAAMKSSIPKQDQMSVFTKGMRTIDWKKVEFPPFSPESCEQKWRDIMQKMRKLRTLTELVVEAEDVISNPFGNIKIHPELPKRPKPPQAIFCAEKWDEYQKKHPEMRKAELLSLLNKMYKGLPDEQKEEYVEKFELTQEEYCERMHQFNKEHRKKGYRSPRMKKRKRKSETVSLDSFDVQQHAEYLEKLPPRPTFGGRNLFYKEQRELRKSRSGKDDEDDEAAGFQHWHELTEEQRDEYRARCKELNYQLSMKRKKYLEILGEAEQQQILRESSSKRPKRRKMSLRKRPVEPKMPSRTANSFFCKEQMELLKEKIPTASKRFTEANHMWKKLSSKEKERYKARVHENMRKYKSEHQKWFKTLSAEQQDDYLSCHRSKQQYLKQPEENKRNRPAAHRTSDSEDEDIEDSGGEDEDHYWDCNEGEEEEEEEEEEDDDDLWRDRW